MPLTVPFYIILTFTIIAALTSHLFNLTLPFAIQLNFTSLITLFTIPVLGDIWALLVALVAHDYFLMIMEPQPNTILLIAEALFVGLTWQRYHHNLFLLDSLFWLCLGLPLLWISYILIPVDPPLSSPIIINTVGNGLLNALLAHVLISYSPLAYWKTHPSLYRPLRTLIQSPSRHLSHQKIAEELRQSQEMLRLVINTIPQYIFWKDTQAVYLGCNQNFAQIVGLDTPEEIIGKTDLDLINYQRTDSLFFQMLSRSMIADGKTQYQHIESLQLAEGDCLWLEMNKIPLRDGQGHIIGVLGSFEDITERKRTEQRLVYLAHYDELTGLPNRSLFYEKAVLAIRDAKQQGKLIGLMFVDLDHFKYVNDTLGHVVGDILLKKVAHRLTQCLRKEDTLARLGGDDFIILLETVQTDQEIIHITQTIIDAMQVSFDLKGYETYVTATIGISIYPYDGEDVDTLLKNADAAMYRAKEKGRNNYQFFLPQMNVHSHKRLTLESKLRHALERNEFLVYYQPQMHLATGIIVGAEALLRWQHPDLGLILPYNFIPLAEETGLIVQIGEWVLHRACLQHRQWRDNGLPILRMSVNLSPRQFRQPNLSQHVIQIVEANNVDPTLLELELTESMLMQDADMAAKILQELKDRGFQLAIDDFGTGYSSLSYLRRFPIDKLKIDQSFVREIPTNQDDMTITRAIVALAKSLNLKVIAEGVETKPQAAFLKTLRCDEVQGYLIGRPMPAEEFIKLFHP